MTGTCRRCIAALTLALAVALGGCGGSDNSDQFREDYNAAVDKLSKINTDIGQAGSGGANESNAAIAKEFQRIADTAEQTRGDLSKLDPPGDAQDEVDKLLSSLQDGVRDLRSVAKAAKANDPQKAREAVQELSKSGEEITAAETALKEAVDG